jgi:hypothetical protein
MVDEFRTLVCVRVVGDVKVTMKEVKHLLELT